MVERIITSEEQLLIDNLQYFSENQDLWFEIFGAMPSEGRADEMLKLTKKLCAGGEYTLMLQAIYIQRHERPIARALTSLLVSLLTEKIQRDGIEQTAALFLQMAERLEADKGKT